MEKKKKRRIAYSAVGHECIVLLQELAGELSVRANGAAAQQEDLSVLQQPFKHLSNIS